MRRLSVRWWPSRRRNVACSLATGGLRVVRIRSALCRFCPAARAGAGQPGRRLICVRSGTRAHWPAAPAADEAPPLRWLRCRRLSRPRARAPVPDDVCPPLRGLLRVTARVSDRQLQGGAIRTVDVGSGSLWRALHRSPMLTVQQAIWTPQSCRRSRMRRPLTGLRRLIATGDRNVSSPPEPQLGAGTYPGSIVSGCAD